MQVHVVSYPCENCDRKPPTFTKLPLPYIFPQQSLTDQIFLAFKGVLNTFTSFSHLSQGTSAPCHHHGSVLTRRTQTIIHFRGINFYKHLFLHFVLLEEQIRKQTFFYNYLQVSGVSKFLHLA